MPVTNGDVAISCVCVAQVGLGSVVCISKRIVRKPPLVLVVTGISPRRTTSASVALAVGSLGTGFNSELELAGVRGTDGLISTQSSVFLTIRMVMPFIHGTAVTVAAGF